LSGFENYATLLQARIDRLNICGNNVRLIAAIHYNRRKVYIRAVLTHAEYDAGKWKGK
jgi:mRNA-degrading endonuclease HigB of HigAB toxin-antitoxin module